jgi:hypothetical protein
MSSFWDTLEALEEQLDELEADLAKSADPIDRNTCDALEQLRMHLAELLARNARIANEQQQRVGDSAVDPPRDAHRIFDALG